MIKIGRAHTYDDVDRCRAVLAAMPAQWLEAIDWVSWWILPEGLSPQWIGLLKKDRPTHAGFLYSEASGWFANIEHGWLVSSVPHIFVSAGCRNKTALHEAGHALAVEWHVDVRKFFRPEKALYDYMASNADEYFACAIEAFLTPDSDANYWNRFDLAVSDADLFGYLQQKMIVE